MRKVIAVLMMVMLAATLAGCDAVQRKFTRKKKPTPRAPKVMQIKKYEKKPSPELYKKHYAYWEAWQKELIAELGESHKNDASCIEQIISNVRDMQNNLVKSKSDELEPHIKRLEEVRDMIGQGELSSTNKDWIRRTLEREERFIRREFYYDKVKHYLRKSFDDDTTPAGETADVALPQGEKATGDAPAAQ